MENRGLQMSLMAMLALVACVALNIWCFRVHLLLGLVSLNVSKHVAIAGLCRAVGVNRRTGAESPFDIVRAEACAAGAGDSGS
jgi:hypothetical protein